MQIIDKAIYGTYCVVVSPLMWPIWLRRRLKRPRKPKIDPDSCPLLKDIPLQRPKDLRIQAYPPRQDYAEATPIRQMLDMHGALIHNIVIASKLNRDDAQRFLIPVIVNLAHLVHQVPASQYDHHKGYGGLFAHSLQVAFFAANESGRCLFDIKSSPRLMVQNKPRWNLTAILAALAHDIGKPYTDMEITAEDGRHWPKTVPLLDWLRRENIERYTVSFKPDREHNDHKLLAIQMLNALVPKLTWEYLGGTGCAQIFTRAITEAIMKGKEGSYKIGEILDSADAASRMRDAEVRRQNALADLNVSHPQAEPMLQAIRTLVKSGRWTTNKDAASRIWNTRLGCFVVWTDKTAKEVWDQAQDSGFKGLPCDFVKLAQILYDASVIREFTDRDSDERSCLWRVTPIELGNKVFQCIRFGLAGHVFPDAVPPEVAAIVEGEPVDEETKRAWIERWHYFPAQKMSPAEEVESGFNQNYIEQIIREAESNLKAQAELNIAEGLLADAVCEPLPAAEIVVVKGEGGDETDELIANVVGVDGEGRPLSPEAVLEDSKPADAIPPSNAMSDPVDEGTVPVEEVPQPRSWGAEKGTGAAASGKAPSSAGAPAAKPLPDSEVPVSEKKSIPESEQNSERSGKDDLKEDPGTLRNQQDDRAAPDALLAFMDEERQAEEEAKAQKPGKNKAKAERRQAASPAEADFFGGADVEDEAEGGFDLRSMLDEAEDAKAAVEAAAAEASEAPAEMPDFGRFDEEDDAADRPEQQDHQEPVPEVKSAAPSSEPLPESEQETGVQDSEMETGRAAHPNPGAAGMVPQVGARFFDTPLPAPKTLPPGESPRNPVGKPESAAGIGKDRVPATPGVPGKQNEENEEKRIAIRTAAGSAAASVSSVPEGKRNSGKRADSEQEFGKPGDSEENSQRLAAPAPGSDTADQDPAAAPVPVSSPSPSRRKSIRKTMADNDMRRAQAEEMAEEMLLQMTAGSGRWITDDVTTDMVTFRMGTSSAAFENACREAGIKDFLFDQVLEKQRERGRLPRIEWVKDRHRFLLIQS